MEPVRFTDILTTALSIANYQRLDALGPAQVLTALELLDGTTQPAELDPPQSPALPTVQAGPEVAAEVSRVVQHWWDDLGRDPLATLSDTQLAGFRRDIRAIGDGRE